LQRLLVIVLPIKNSMLMLVHVKPALITRSEKVNLGVTRRSVQLRLALVILKVLKRMEPVLLQELHVMEQEKLQTIGISTPLLVNNASKEQYVTPPLKSSMLMVIVN
jgi:hypothetical protein